MQLGVDLLMGQLEGTDGLLHVPLAALLWLRETLLSNL
jgi:hypothetical protein